VGAGCMVGIGGRWRRADDLSVALEGPPNRSQRSNKSVRGERVGVQHVWGVCSPFFLPRVMHWYAIANEVNDGGMLGPR
jgi:hypothetical protein